MGVHITRILALTLTAHGCHTAKVGDSKLLSTNFGAWRLAQTPYMILLRDGFEAADGLICGNAEFKLVTCHPCGLCFDMSYILASVKASVASLNTTIQATIYYERTALVDDI